MCEGYWPGALSNQNYFFDERMLHLWYHIRHKIPGTSDRKFIEALEGLSQERGRLEYKGIT